MRHWSRPKLSKLQLSWKGKSTFSTLLNSHAILRAQKEQLKIEAKETADQRAKNTQKDTEKLEKYQATTSSEGKRNGG